MTTAQKQKIQQMRCKGQSYLQIASNLCISENTIKSYCRRNNLGDDKRSKSKTINEIQTVCKNCGKPLMQGTKGQPKKFCSDECSRIWWKDNDSQLIKKAYYILICAECGKEFKSYGNQNRKFCSHSCYINNRFKKVGNEHDTRAI